MQSLRKDTIKYPKDNRDGVSILRTISSCEEFRHICIDMFFKVGWIGIEMVAYHGNILFIRSWAMMVKVNYLLWMGSLFIRFGLKVTNRSNFLLMKKKNWLLCSFRPLRSPIKRPEFRGRKSSADELARMTKLECKSISHSKTFIKLFDISFKIGWIHNQNITSQIQAFKLFKMPLFCAHFAKLSRNFQNYLTISIILSSLI